MVQDLEVGILDHTPFAIQNLGCKASGPGCKVEDSEVKVQGFIAGVA